MPYYFGESGEISKDQLDMSLLEDIEDIKTNLQNGDYRQESDIVDHIVQRLLETLGWPRYDPKIKSREYFMESGRPDLVLFHPPTKPIIFIEAKYINKITNDSKKQLFRYAFDQGVPIAILTDGQEWFFYLPSGQGNYDERIFCHFNLLDDDVEKHAELLDKYLSYDNCKSGSAITAAKDDFDKVVKIRRIKELLPKVFDSLIEMDDEYHETLIDIIKEKAQKLFSVTPANEYVEEFLDNSISYTNDSQENIVPYNQQTANAEKASNNIPQNIDDSSIGYFINGKFYSETKAIKIMVGILNELNNLDRSFLDRFVNSKYNKGTERIYVSKNKNEVFFHGRSGDRPPRQLTSGYWLYTVLSNNTKKELIKGITIISGLKYGDEFYVNFGEK
jgi:hypothetical protein